MTELHEVYDVGDRHYLESLRFLGDSVTLIEDFVHLYLRATAIAGGSPVANREEHLMGVHFLMAAQYYLVIGTVACFRGHITDSFASTRMAIEQAAFAARVKRHPHLAAIWRDAGEDETAYAEYREKFTRLFPHDHVLLRELGTRYDFCAKLTHPSIHSFATRSRFEVTEEHLTLRLDYFQLKEDGSEPVRTFLWILNTHMFIARVFQEVLAAVLVGDASAYEVQMNAVEVKLASHCLSWQERIPALMPIQR